MTALPPSTLTPFAALSVSDEFLSFYNRQRDAAAPPATSPLHVSVLNGDRARVTSLLAGNRADPRACDQVRSAYFAFHQSVRARAWLMLQHRFVQRGYTALHHAALLGHLDVCSLLIASGADVNAVACVDGSTPLHKAAQGGHAAIVRKLLTHGALHPVLNSVRYHHHRPTDGVTVTHSD